MFTAYHAIMFAVLLIGGAGVIFQASSGDDSLANNPIPVKATESNFDLNIYYVQSRFNRCAHAHTSLSHKQLANNIRTNAVKISA